MAGKVTSLSYQKHNKDRVNIEIDGRFAFGLAAIHAAHLCVGQFLSDEQISDLGQRDAVEKGFEHALGFLSYRPRSEAEVRRNLQKHQLRGDAIDAVVERLRTAGLVDDTEFARYWVQNRAQFNPRGVFALRQELRQKGIRDEVVGEVLENVDEAACAQSVARRGACRYKDLEETEFRRKLTAYLGRRGFSYGVIESAVSEQTGLRHDDASAKRRDEGA